MSDIANEKIIHESTFLSSMESDAIGEILNISMGAAATAISTLLSRTVNITTPIVSIIKADDFECKSLEPAVGIEIEYIEGLSGSNFMVMKQRDIRAIVNLLLMEDNDIDIDIDEELDEMHLSAINEIMNQMMGASSTAMASFFGKEVNISTPKQFEIAKMHEKVFPTDNGGNIVTIKFILKIEDLLDSEFITIMPGEFTKELVNSAISLGETEITETKMPGKIPAPELVQDIKPSTKPIAESLNLQPQMPTYNAEQQQPKVQTQTAQTSVKPLKLPSFDQETTSTGIPGKNQAGLGLIMNVPLEVSVEIGRTRMSVKDILEIRQGSLVELDKQTGDPVDIIVNGQLMAKGDVVTIDDNFGVRITEIISEKDFVKSMV